MDLQPFRADHPVIDSGAGEVATDTSEDAGGSGGGTEEEEEEEEEGLGAVAIDENQPWSSIASNYFCGLPSQYCGSSLKIIYGKNVNAGVFSDGFGFA